MRFIREILCAFMSFRKLPVRTYSLWRSKICCVEITVIKKEVCRKRENQVPLSTSAWSLAMTYCWSSSDLPIHRNLCSVFRSTDISSERPLPISSSSLQGFLSLHSHSTLFIAACVSGGIDFSISYICTYFPPRRTLSSLPLFNKYLVHDQVFK